MGKGGGQTIGYHYYLGMHLVPCHGPCDNVSRLQVDNRTAWIGTSTGGAVAFSATDLFGGDKREGGVSGTVDVCMGDSAQLQNDYLVAQLGDTVPAYRGVLSLIFRQCYLGNNPYLKPWSVQVQRIHTTTGGATQWYDAKAEISSENPDIGSTTYYHLDPIFPRLGTGDPGYPTPGNVYPASLTIGPFGYDVEVRGGMNVSGADSNCQADDAFLFNGSPYPGDPENATASYGNAQTLYVLPAGQTLIVQVENTHNSACSATGYMKAVPLSPNADMNPAHIIRECLTDTVWGLGYTSADIDDTSFTAAADTLYAEGMGISLLWDQQTTIEDFVTEIVRHIDAALYVSPTTGKFVLKLIRNDYTVGSLVLLDESNIIRVDNPSTPQFAELANSVTVNYWSSATDRTESVTIKDPALIQMQGTEINTTVQYPGFSCNRNAMIAAQRDLRSLSTPVMSCTVYANHDAAGLNIGDVFKLTWGKWQVTNRVMRITGLAVGDGRSNLIKIDCVEDIFSTNTTQLAASATTEWTDPSAQPTPVTYQLGLEFPYYEVARRLGQSTVDNELASTTDIGYVGVAAARSDAAINARLYTDAGSGYTDTGAMDFCPVGTLTADIGYTDTTVILTNVQDLDLVETGTYAQIDDELVRIDSVDTATNTVTIGRGVLDTVPAQHSSGAAMFFWEGYAGFDGTQYVSGETINEKVLPVTGQGQLLASAATALSVTLAQRAFKPYPPGDLQINATSYSAATFAGTLTISWVGRDRTQETGATLYDYSYGNIGPEAGVTYRALVYVDGVLDHTEDPATTGFTVDPSTEGLVRVEVASLRDSVYSWQSAYHEFFYLFAGNVRFVETGASRYTEEGNIRTTED